MPSWLRRSIAALSLCAAGMSPALAVSETDLLPVDDAFALTASAPSRGRIELGWRIADGYYLYRHRIAVQPVNSAFKSNPLQLPRGAKHHDEFFGEVETYRQTLVAVQTGAAATGVEVVTLRVKYQGCADVGVCYPPQTRTLTVALPADAVVADAGFAALGRGLAGASRAPLPGAVAGEPLPPEQAFAFEAIVGDGNSLLLRFTPAKGYYLYRDNTSFKLSGASGIAPGTPRWPPGVAHRDEHFGNVVVYFDQAEVPLPLRRTRTEATDIQLAATFQGCQDGGICRTRRQLQPRRLLPWPRLRSMTRPQTQSSPPPMRNPLARRRPQPIQPPARRKRKTAAWPPHSPATVAG
ncbi:MAG: protein-disulfide reductase DsbD domain-containing protein [Luteimonas sp.]